MTSPRFVFDGETSFEDFMHQLETYDIDSFLTTLSPYHYQSFYNRTGVQLDSIETFDEPVLEAILNAYGVVEIAGYIVRVHPSWDSYHILPNTASSADQQIFERAASDADGSNLPIPTTTFPTTCDFFANLDADNAVFPSHCAQQSSCNDDCASGRGEGNFDDYACTSGSYQSRLRVWYRRFGIWNSMRVVFRHEKLKGINKPPEGSPVKIDRSIIANWRGKCNRNIGLFYESYSGSYSSRGATKTLYTGPRCLHRFNVSAGIKYKDKCDGTI
jgi:hypothetical protein